MRVVFLGSPEFALPSLRALINSNHELVAVVTQPDRPAGRGHGNRPPPVKELAEGEGLLVLQPNKVSDDESLARLRELEPDLLVVAAYGQILRQRLLDLPAIGALNVHASLLPRWRGASPISGAILAGDSLSGATIMKMVRALDAGPIVAQHQEAISDLDTAGSLEERLATSGATLLMDVLEPWASGRLTALPQVDDLATYAGLLKRQEAEIDWSLPAVEIWRGVRAYNPWPGAFTNVEKEEVKVWQAWPLSEDTGDFPGTVLEVGDLPPPAESIAKAPRVQTGEGSLALVTVQPAGRRPMTGLDFVRGRSRLVGTRLGLSSAES